MEPNEISGQLVDPISGKISPSRIIIEDGVIKEIVKDENAANWFILPGLVDSHIHVESTMLMPSRFAAMAATHGTLGAVCDPHEIANILGTAGIDGFLSDAKAVPFSFVFGAPSSVPATEMETSGARLDADQIRPFFFKRDLRFLGEVMNVPGVLNRDPETLKKIALAREFGLPIDGHAPGLSGDELKRYCSAGITTDHECVSLAEAREKIRLGMMIQLREGSAARNFDDLLPLFGENPERLMLCSDDKHPDDLVAGHINQLVARVLKAGYPLKDALRAASVNPIEHYRIPLGLLREGDSADFILVEPPIEKMRVSQAWYRGRCVTRDGVYLASLPAVELKNNFVSLDLRSEALLPPASSQAIEAGQGEVRVIEVEDGQLVTGMGQARLTVSEGKFQPDPTKDLLLLCVVNRYDRHAKPAIAFIRGFGLKKGALASSVAHDSHNIIAIGSDESSLLAAIERVAKEKGGIIALDGEGNEEFLSLPYGGIVSTEDCLSVANLYRGCDAFAKERLGSNLKAPFMTLSFMALLVIPELKLGDRGLFDGTRFKFVDLELGLKPNQV